MSELLKWWKRIKWIRRIIAIASIVTTVVSVYLWFSDITVYADVRKQEEVGITSELSDGSIAPSGSVQALLESCEKIAKYMNNHNPRYTYSWSGLTTRYDDGSPYSCCATYVSWCLQDAGFIEDSQHFDNVYGDHELQNCTPQTIPTDGVWSVLYNDSKWKQFVVDDESKMYKGDVVIYKTGKSHINIYAGDGQYWDAGSSGTGAFIGTTKTHTMDGYTCLYRYMGD